MCVCVYVCVYVCMCVWMYVCVFLCMHMRDDVRMCVCMCVSHTWFSLAGLALDLARGKGLLQFAHLGDLGAKQLRGRGGLHVQQCVRTGPARQQFL